MIDPFKTDLEQSSQILKRFALARALIVSIVAVYCALLHVKAHASFDLNNTYLFVILGVALVESLLAVATISAGYKPTMRFSSILLCSDLVLISALILMTGGSASVFVFLYIAVILSASLLLSLNWSVAMATICSLLFFGVMMLEFNGVVLPASPFLYREIEPAGLHLWADTVMKIFAFYLTAFLGGLLSHRVGLLQSFHENILNSLSSGYVSINRDRTVTYLNPAGSTLLKRARMDVLGKDISAVFPVADTQRNPLIEAITKKRETNSREIAVTRGDGKTIPVGITVSPIVNTARKLLGAVGSFIDLTDLKRMEERLRRADRLAAVGETSASLAHEIRNPVASIRGAVQELSENLSLEGTNKQLMVIAVRECDQLAKIVSRFLEFVGGGDGRAEERFDIVQLLDEVVDIARRNFCNGNGEIRTDFASSLGHMTGDRSQLREALLNIMRNGKEAMPAGGALRIRAGAEWGDQPLLNIIVEDEGIGIPRDDVEKLFNPFFTTKQGGTGLGLAIAHKVVTSHKGSIDIESDVGKGTRVKIVLPRQDEREDG
jgi:two-component system sensor histidine kinase PilS (NtrC family)